MVNMLYHFILPVTQQGGLWSPLLQIRKLNSVVKSTKIINSKWQSRNLKPGRYRLYALPYVRIGSSDHLWKESKHRHANSWRSCILYANI